MAPDCARTQVPSVVEFAGVFITFSVKITVVWKLGNSLAWISEIVDHPKSLDNTWSTVRTDLTKQIVKESSLFPTIP